MRDTGVEAMRIHGAIYRATALAGAILLASAGAAMAADLEVLVVDPAFSPYNLAGQTATIRGIGFTPSTTVSFGTTSATVTYVDSRTLTVTIPTMGSAQVTTVTVDDPANGTDTFYPFLHTGPVYYVAPTGSDNNNGTSPATPKLTIGAGLDASDGSTPSEIRVAEGTYAESEIPVFDRDVLSCGWDPNFASRDPDAHVTVIDAGHSSFVLRSAGIEAASAIDGCTIRNGRRDGLGGGGIIISADSMIVSHNVLVGNATAENGGGVYFITSTSYGGRPTVSQNVFIGNRAHNKNGGAIGLYADYDAQTPVRVNVTGNEIVGNRSFNGRGGGFALSTGTYAGYNVGTLKLSGNVFEDNSAKTGGGAAVTLFTFGDLYDTSMQNNLFAANTAQGTGGGAAFEGSGGIDGLMAGNTFADNAASPNLGGGLHIDGAMTLLPSFRASDMILWGNAGGDVSGQAVSAVEWSDTGAALAGAGDISADPAFTAGPMGSYYLVQNDPNQADSPAVDAGSDLSTALSVDALTTRTDGASDTGVADMGYHYEAAPAATGNPVSILRVDPSSGDLNGADWVLVRGDGFDEGAAVDFDGVAATETRWLGPRRLLARPASHALGAVDVTVQNPDMTSATAASAYQYVDNLPPEWPTTVGLISAQGGLDCVRSALLTWNPAVDVATPPVVYDVYREECLASTNTATPCSNFGYVPNATNLLGTTIYNSFIDTNFSSSGADKKWLYMVRARDSFAPANQEWNFAKRLTLVGTSPGETTPPPPIGDNLRWAPGSTTELDWPSEPGAVSYGFYREVAAAPYADPNIVPFLLLDATNNDVDGDGVVDASRVDADVPSPGEIYFYRVTALDPCGNETRSELLP